MHRARATPVAFRRRLRRGAAIAAARGTTTLTRRAAAPALPGLVAERIDLDPRGLRRVDPPGRPRGRDQRQDDDHAPDRAGPGEYARMPADQQPIRREPRTGDRDGTGRGSDRGIPAPAVFEVDEWAFSRVSRALEPDVIVILNLLRDQLDRYGEIDAVAERWSDDLSALDARTQLVVCADTPLVEVLAGAAQRRTWRFGLRRAVASVPIPTPDPPWSGRQRSVPAMRRTDPRGSRRRLAVLRNGRSGSPAAGSRCPSGRARCAGWDPAGVRWAAGRDGRR